MFASEKRFNLKIVGFLLPLDSRKSLCLKRFTEHLFYHVTVTTLSVKFI